MEALAVSRATIIIRRVDDRLRAMKWIRQMPHGGRVEFKGPSRSVESNAKMWAMLSDIARQHLWHGEKLTPDDYKDIFTAALRKERLVPDLDGTGFVRLGLHTSDMSGPEMSEMISLMEAWGAQNGVRFADERVAA